jgi:hypothetical protein
MYDQFLSPNWLLDNKIVIIPVELAIIITVVFLLTYFTVIYVKKFHILIQIIVTLISALLIFVLTSFIGLMAYEEYLSNSYWRPINNAHAIHALIKEYKIKNGVYPPEQESLRSFDISKYDQMVKLAKVKYIYDKENDKFTFFVRASKSDVIIFDSQSDYAIYDLNNSNYNGKTYPPKYQGPWDQLPQ